MIDINEKIYNKLRNLLCFFQKYFMSIYLKKRADKLKNYSGDCAFNYYQKWLDRHIIQ